jgi:hypothetical protein
LSHRDWEPMPSIPGALVLSLNSLRRGARLVRMAGNLDEQAREGLLGLAGDELSPSLDLLILDLTNVSALAPEDVSTLVRIAAQLGEANVGLGLVAADGVVGPVLDEAGVRSLFELNDSIDEALDIP